MVDETKKWPHGKRKSFYLDLMEREPEAAMTWLRSVFHLSKEKENPYLPTMKRAKRRLGMSLKIGSDFQDSLLDGNNRLRQAIRDLYSTTVAKKPKSNSEHFGIEIECFIKPNRGENLADTFQQYCVAKKIKGAHYKHDGSIRADEGFSSAEITLLVPRENIRDLELVCDWLAERKARVNGSCGLHVHLDFRNKASVMEKCADRLANSLPYLALLIPETRRYNDEYCKMGRNHLGNDSRYYAINTHAFPKFKTVEVRLHSGTVSFKKISSWMLILSNIIDNPAFDTKPTDKSIDKFVQLLKFEQNDLVYYIYERYEKFNKGSNRVKTEIGEE